MRNRHALEDALLRLQAQGYGTGQIYRTAAGELLAMVNGRVPSGERICEDARVSLDDNAVAEDKQMAAPASRGS